MKKRVALALKVVGGLMALGGGGAVAWAFGRQAETLNRAAETGTMTVGVAALAVGVLLFAISQYWVE